MFREPKRDASASILSSTMTLAPGFLIASPPLGDPNFERTVVLLAMHGPRGALGFVVNRLAPIQLGEVMNLAGYGPRYAGLGGAVHAGGPVEPGSGWILYSGGQSGASGEGIIEVAGDVRISSSREAFDTLAKDVEPSHEAASIEVPELRKLRAEPVRRMVFLGYSGWGPGQVEGEIAQGAWLPAPFDAKVLFDVELEHRWEAAYALMGVTPAMSIGMRTVGDA